MSSLPQSQRPFLGTQEHLRDKQHSPPWPHKVRVARFMRQFQTALETTKHWPGGNDRSLAPPPPSPLGPSYTMDPSSPYEIHDLVLKAAACKTTMHYALPSPQHSERTHTEAEANGSGACFPSGQKGADRAEGLTRAMSTSSCSAGLHGHCKQPGMSRGL